MKIEGGPRTIQTVTPPSGEKTGLKRRPHGARSMMCISPAFGSPVAVCDLRGRAQTATLGLAYKIATGRAVVAK
jgi:hypothetical protein